MTKYEINITLVIGLTIIFVGAIMNWYVRHHLTEFEINLIITIVTTLVAILVGAIITWCVGRHYYQQAGKELSEEAAELRRLTTLVLRSMENAGLVELSRDTSGKIVGIVIRAELKINVTTNASAKGEVFHP